MHYYYPNQVNSDQQATSQTIECPLVVAAQYTTHQCQPINHKIDRFSKLLIAKTQWVYAIIRYKYIFNLKIIMMYSLVGNYISYWVQVIIGILYNIKFYNSVTIVWYVCSFGLNEETFRDVRIIIISTYCCLYHFITKPTSGTPATTILRSTR